MSSNIRNYYVKVSYDSGQQQNVYELSGEELTQWTGDFVATTQSGLIHPFTGYSGIGCSETIYFWQEDPSNYGHDFHLSDTLDGHHDAFGGYTLGGNEGFTESGVMGTSGAHARLDLEQFTAFQMDPSSIAFSWVYPFCWHHAGMGNTGNVFECEAILTECPIDCNLSSGMSGAAATLSGDANVQLSGIYGTHEILSSSVTTGVQMGQYNICEINGTGLTSAESISRANNLTGTFFRDGVCTDEGAEDFTQLNVSGVNITFSAPHTSQYSSNYYETYITGYSDRRHYVVYDPIVSGNKTVTSIDTDCPSTALQVTIGRSRTIHTLETLIAILSGAVHDVRVTLPADCAGYRTSLTASCPKFAGGYELFGEKTFTQGNELCWDAYFKTGIYRLEHDAASSFLATDKHSLGSGTLTAKAYV
jgi:hypothetical protein